MHTPVHPRHEVEEIAQWIGSVMHYETKKSKCVNLG